jgi:mRNA interferase RelE/StbE
MYSVEISEKASKQISKLENNTQERIVASLERIRIRPITFIKKLVGADLYSLRVGDYRIILDIQNDKLIILVIDIGHRSIVYRFYEKKEKNLI